MILVLIKPYYLAPEILLQEYTYKIDMWSIGIITFILLCGYPPFAGYNDYETLELVRSAKLEFSSPEWDDITSEAKDFITLLLSRDPEMRPSAREAMNHPWLKKYAHTNDTSFFPFQKRDSLSAGDRALHMDSRKSSAFQKYLATSKIKKTLSAVSDVASPIEANYLGKILDKVDKRVDKRESLEDIDNAIETEILSDSVKSNLQQMRSVIDKPRRRGWTMPLAPFLQSAIKNREKKKCGANFFESLLSSSDKG